MPSAEHESPVALNKLNPDTASWLLMNIFDIKIPGYDHARSHATDVRILVPRTFHADSMLLYCDADDQPLLGVVFEVQRGWDPSKRRTWKLYVAQLEAELDVPAALLVYCPDPKIARRFRDLFESDGLSLTLRPFIFTPDDVPLVTDLDFARANPSVTVLSAICHGDRPDVDTVFPALAEALRSLGAEKAILYYDVVLAGLPEATRARWEAFMTTAVDYEFRSEFATEYVKLGEARGEARAVLAVLEGRGIAVSTDLRDQILACTDLARLDTWLRRASTATTIDDVTAE